MLPIKKIRFSDNYILDVVIVLLGSVVLTFFYSLLFEGLFTAQIFAATLTDSAQFAGPYVKSLTSLLISNSEFIAPALGIAMFITSILLILLIARGIMTVLTGIGFCIAWILLWRYPGMWTYELLFPALFAMCAGLAKITQPLFGLSIYTQLSISKFTKIILIFLLSVLLAYVTFLAQIHSAVSYKIAISSGLTFLVVSCIHLGIDQWLKNKNIQTKTSKTDSIWIDVMIIIMGSMMVAQVYSNYYSGLYTFDGFKNLGEYYSTATASIWLSQFLSWAGNYSSILLPFFISYEVIIAILLVLLIFRGPVTLLASGLFFLLGFAEFGVSSTWPPTSGFYNEEWELLLPAVISLLIGIGKLEEMFRAKTWREMILGRKIFYSLSSMSRILIATTCAVALYFAGMVTHIFGSPYIPISISAAITFFILLILLAWIDQYRSE